MRKYITEAFMVGLALLISITVASAYAQFIEVSGKYTNEEAGVEITFPDGWSGAEIGVAEALLVVAAPGGMGEAEVTKSITLITAEKSTNRDPQDPSSFSQESLDCNDPSVKSVSVAGVQGYEAIVECPSTDSKMKMVSVGTTDKWVVVMYVSPTSEFDSDVGKFDATVNSLKIQGAVNSEGVPGTPTEEEPSSSMMPVMVAGESIAVSVESSSTISNFALNEGSMMLSFKADGTGDETVVSVGKILEGPYTVIVDGQATTDFEESTDDQGVKTITVSHGTGTHDVTVTGTQVVPEFPVAVIGVIAAIIGIVAIIGRTRLVTGHRQT